jgi:spore maturation protein A
MEGARVTCAPTRVKALKLAFRPRTPSSERHERDPKRAEGATLRVHGERSETVNIVFVLLFVAAAIAGAVKGDMKSVGQGAFDGAAQGVTLAIGLIGVMALWLGLMRIAEKAGLIDKLARAVRPVFRPLFPGVPDGHPAISAMLLNIAANMLGLGNAATPFGIKAMEELDKLNPTPGTATNAQVLFLAINTASLQLVPTTVIALRASAHSKDPAGILLPTLLSTFCALTIAIVSAKILERFWK